MTEIPAILLALLAFVLVIGPLVFLHEGGHYLAGRLFGVKAEEFSIGFGREVAGFTDKRGTRWRFSWIPLGGFVRFAGDMNPASEPTAEWLQLPAAEREKTFQAKKLWQRAIIVAAGPVTNFIIAILILGAFALIYGQNRTPTVAGTVVEGSPAATAGLQAGDRITALGGRSVDTFGDMARYTQLRPGERVTVAFERDGEARKVDAVIGTLVERDRFGNEYRIGQLGIGPGEPVLEKVGVLEAPWVGITTTASIMQSMVDGLGQIITGRRPVSEMAGPIRMAGISGQRLMMGPTEFVFLIALISINLGFINLLPLPMLDGGHLLFYGYEAIRRRPAPAVAQEWAFRFGFVAIVTLMLVVTFNDLGSIGVWDGIARLIG